VARTLTPGSGFFRLSAETAGDFYLVGSAFGYRTTTVGVFELGEGGEMSVEFRIPSAPMEIEGVTVDLERLVREPALIRNGFYDRLRQGNGYFITPGDIEKSLALGTSDLLYNIPRLQFETDELGRERITMPSPLGDCTPNVYVDGLRLTTDGLNLNSIAPLFNVEAIEVFRGASELPLQYSGTQARGCGAIVIWTKGN
jgi:hypothetical protein